MKDWTPEGQHQACLAVDAAARSRYAELCKRRQLQNMTYQEIAALAAAGVDIQLHTHCHFLDPMKPSLVEQEIGLNRDRLAPVTSKPLRHFCYPSGVYSPDMFPYLERAGIRSATTVGAGLNDRHSNRFALSRILDGEYVSLLEIEAELSGFLEMKRKVTRALHGKRAAALSEH
jgi:peptidoglycan/xylan/chitin deacetylase (PgdA/CDA1 family)